MCLPKKNVIPDVVEAWSPLLVVSVQNVPHRVYLNTFPLLLVLFGVIMAASGSLLEKVCHRWGVGSENL